MDGWMNEAVGSSSALKFTEGTGEFSLCSRYLIKQLRRPANYPRAGSYVIIKIAG